MENITLSGPERAPVSGGKPKQLIILLHGLGSNGEDLMGLVPYIAPQFPDAQFLSPNAPSPCDMAPYGYQWFSLREWTPQAMLKGAHDVLPKLNMYIDTQLKRFGLTDDKLALIGFSQGTMMSLYAALRRPKPCAAVVGYSGVLIGQEGVISTPPVCLIHGVMDTVVPFGAMALADALLKQFGVKVETHARPLLGHSIDAEGLDIAINFLKAKFV